MNNKYLLLFLSILLAACNNQAQQQDPIPVHDTFTIASKQVGEKRTINVWTTENNKNITFQYSNEPKEEHQTIYLATKEKALIWTLNT